MVVFSLYKCPWIIELIESNQHNAKNNETRLTVENWFVPMIIGMTSLNHTRNTELIFSNLIIIFQDNRHKFNQIHSCLFFVLYLICQQSLSDSEHCFIVTNAI